MVWPVISYGAAIWGTKEYSCINAVQHRACRFFLGVGKYTPNAAVNGEMGWQPPLIKQWKSVMGLWFRLNSFGENILNFQVFKWTHRVKIQCKNWCQRVEHKLSNDTNTN